LPLAGNCRIQCIRRYSEAVNADPYGAGWMIKLKLRMLDYDSLLSDEAYKELIGA
jgi:glycine cleavage system H protein